MRIRTTRTATALVLALTTVGLRAETHTFVPAAFHTTLSSRGTAALTIRSGDTVRTMVLDDRGAGADGTEAGGGAVPLTGPFRIEGAEPGDLLVVTVAKLTPNRTVGYSTSTMVPASIDPGSLTSRPDPTRFAWTIDTAKGVARLDLGVFRGVDWKSRFVDPALELPLAPALGAIGVAPAGEEQASAASPGTFGGNMVSAAVTEGTRVMLEVKQPGALLYMGHGMVAKGEGFVTGTGIETSLDVEFSVEVVKKREWPHSSDVRPSTVVGEFLQGWPRLESGTYLTTVGTASDFLQALQHATIEMHHWLDDDFGLNEKSVSILMGQALEYEIARVSEGSFTVAARLRKAYLPRAVQK